MKTLATILLILLSTHALANDATVYVGYGQNKNLSEESAMSFGFLATSDAGATVGIDIGLEGATLDSTYQHYNKAERSWSASLVLGGTTDNGLTVGVMLGVRETSVSCPKSYIGFRCYADTDPERTVKFQPGLLVSKTFDSNIMVGGRFNEASSQLVLGVRF